MKDAAIIIEENMQNAFEQRNTSTAKNETNVQNPDPTGHVKQNRVRNDQMILENKSKKRVCIQCKREGVPNPEPAEYFVTGSVDGRRVSGYVCHEHEKYLYKDSNERLKTYEIQNDSDLVQNGGRQVYVGTQSNPDDRMVINISEADYNQLDHLRGKPGKTITIIDQSTGRKVKLESAPCGLGCYCAVDFVREV